MAKIKRVLRCFNCGAVLQTSNENELGFIDENIINVNQADHTVLYCNSCYDKMKAINTGMLEKDVDEEIVEILKNAQKNNSVIVWVVDAFEFNGRLNIDVVNAIKGCDLSVVITKMDIFPKTVNTQSFIKFVQAKFNEYRLSPISIISKNVKSKEDVLKNILKNKSFAGRDVYVIGRSESGKTTIINDFLKTFINKTNKIIKTEKLDNTNLKVLQIPLTSKTTLFELPGFSLINSVYGKVEKNVQKIIQPKKNLKCYVKILEDNETMMIGSLASLTVIKGKNTHYYFYGSSNLETKKVKAKNLDNVLSENYLKRSLRPVSDKLVTFRDYDLFEYNMEKDGKYHDILIMGLGWFTFHAKGQIIRIMVPKGTEIKEEMSRIK